MKPEEETSEFWDLVDAVLVLNLDHRPERWEAFQEHVAGMIPEEKLHRVSAVFGKEVAGFGEPPWFRGRRRDDTWAARGGCVLAHRRALEAARDNEWNRVLVLEDDACFTEDFAACLEPLGRELSEVDWDIGYLGFTDPDGPERRLAELAHDHGLFQIFGANCTHAYMIDETTRDWVITQLPDEKGIWPWLSRNRAIDRWYRTVLGQQFQVVAVSPAIVVQAEGFSDIVGRNTLHHSRSKHQTEVKGGVEPMRYEALYARRKFHVRLSRAWDAVRGAAKRFTGF